MVLLNRDRALALMRRSDLDVIVATSPRNVLYFSDYYCWLDPLFKAYMMRPGAPAELSHNLALLPTTGEPALVVPAMWAANAAHSWIHDLWLHGIGDLDLSAVPAALDADAAGLLQRIEAGRNRADAMEALRDLLSERGLANGRIGIDLEGLSPTERQRIHEALPLADVRDCSNLLRVIRMVKSAEEIARLERSTRINYEAAKATLSTADVGTTISQLRRDYVSYVVDAGAQLDHFIASPHGIGLQEVPDYRLEKGDVLYVDYGCISQHYYSDNGTTLVIGGFPREMERRYDVLRDGLQRGIGNCDRVSPPRMCGAR
jgi:Xaa-Pro aminopeptidase